MADEKERLHSLEVIAAEEKKVAGYNAQIVALRQEITALHKAAASAEAAINYQKRLNRFRELLAEAKPGMYYLVNLENLHPEGTISEGCFYCEFIEEGSRCNDAIFNKLPKESAELYARLRGKFNLVPADVTYIYRTSSVGYPDSRDDNHTLEPHNYEYVDVAASLVVQNKYELKSLDLKVLSQVRKEQHNCDFYEAYYPECDLEIDTWEHDDSIGYARLPREDSFNVWVVLK